jgi:CelD/BcsL family acetyltransferase involved in cellulose biosynthesis
MLLVKTMQLACRAGYQQYDFLAGDEAYKMDWCDEHLGLQDQVRGLTFKGKCAAQFMRMVRQAKIAVKQTPRTLEFVKSLNRRRRLFS